MTLIQPNQKSLINAALVALIILLVFVAFSLIFIYNRSVNLEHSVSGSQAELQKLETATAELQDKIFVLLSDDNLQKLSETKGLIKDKNPGYLKIGQRVAPDLSPAYFASQHGAGRENNSGGQAVADIANR